MSGNHEIIISAGNPVKRFPTGLQELYLDVCEDGQPPICHQRLTEKNLKQLIRKIHKRKMLGASLSCPDRRTLSGSGMADLVWVVRENGELLLGEPWGVYSRRLIDVNYRIK